MLTNEAFRRKHADGSIPLVTLSFTEALLVLCFVLFCLMMIGTKPWVIIMYNTAYSALACIR